jgi:hypothetical protein
MRDEIVIRGLRWFKSVLVIAVVGGGFALCPTPALAAVDSAPCSANSVTRQLDYWLGNWTVTYPGTSGSSTSKVYLSLDQCLFIESWDNGKGHLGQNMFAYSPDDKAWYGMFADNQGRVHVFVDGKIASGSAEFNGPSRGSNGETVLNRVKIVGLAPDKVEQTWEKSTDKGGSWTTVFSGEYVRRK